MIITYNVFKVLNEPDSNGKSILDKISDIITEALADIIEISYHCPALIGNIPKFLDCLGF